MTERSADKPVNPYAEAYASFLEQSKDHQLVILSDHGLYRHLRVQAPGTRMWSWDVTTWPGHLATSGDIADGFMFAREPDMLSFFNRAGHRDHYSDGAPSIDVRYWAEKLCGDRSNDVRHYSEQAFLRRVSEVLDESEALGVDAQAFYLQQRATLAKLSELRGDDERRLDELLEDHYDALGSTRHSHDLSRASTALWNVEALSEADIDLLVSGFAWHEVGGTDVPRQSPAEHRAQIIDEAERLEEGEHEAHQWLRDNEQHFGEDTWEWDLRDWDIHFLFTCYAIDLAVQLYRTSTQPTPVTHETLRDMFTEVRLHRDERDAITAWFLEHRAQVVVGTTAQLTASAAATNIPAGLQSEIDRILGSDDYAPYVLDGQTRKSTTGDDWHDVLVTTEAGGPMSVIKFTQNPEGQIEHHVLVTGDTGLTLH